MPILTLLVGKNMNFKLQTMGLHRRTIPLGDTTFRGYSVPLRTLNVELLLFRPLWGRNVRQTCAVLNGILQGTSLNATSLMVPQGDSPATAKGSRA